MRLLLDTHVALWSIANRDRLSGAARALIADTQNAVHISVAALWEIAIKHAIRRGGVAAMPISGRKAAEYFDGAGFGVLSASAAHLLAVEDLPPLHADPFDRLLVAQARAEGMTLLTADAAVARYPGDIRLV